MNLTCLVLITCLIHICYSDLPQLCPNEDKSKVIFLEPGTRQTVTICVLTDTVSDLYPKLRIAGLIFNREMEDMSYRFDWHRKDMYSWLAKARITLTSLTQYRKLDIVLLDTPSRSLSYVIHIRRPEDLYNINLTIDTSGSNTGITCSAPGYGRNMVLYRKFSLEVLSRSVVANHEEGVSQIRLDRQTSCQLMGTYECQVDTPQGLRVKGEDLVMAKCPPQLCSSLNTSEIIPFFDGQSLMISFCLINFSPSDNLMTLNGEQIVVSGTDARKYTAVVRRLSSELYSNISLVIREPVPADMREYTLEVWAAGEGTRFVKEGENTTSVRGGESTRITFNLAWANKECVSSQQTVLSKVGSSLTVHLCMWTVPENLTLAVINGETHTVKVGNTSTTPSPTPSSSRVVVSYNRGQFLDGHPYVTVQWLKLEPRDFQTWLVYLPELNYTFTFSLEPSEEYLQLCSPDQHTRKFQTTPGSQLTFDTCVRSMLVNMFYDFYVVINGTRYPTLGCGEDGRVCVTWRRGELAELTFTFFITLRNTSESDYGELTVFIGHHNHQHAINFTILLEPTHPEKFSSRELTRDKDVYIIIYVVVCLVVIVNGVAVVVVFNVYRSRTKVNRKHSYTRQSGINFQEANNDYMNSRDTPRDQTRDTAPPCSSAHSHVAPLVDIKPPLYPSRSLPSRPGTSQSDTEGRGYSNSRLKQHLPCNNITGHVITYTTIAMTTPLYSTPHQPLPGDRIMLPTRSRQSLSSSSEDDESSCSLTHSRHSLGINSVTSGSCQHASSSLACQHNSSSLAGPKANSSLACQHNSSFLAGPKANSSLACQHNSSSLAGPKANSSLACQHNSSSLAGPKANSSLACQHNSSSLAGPKANSSLACQHNSSSLAGPKANSSLASQHDKSSLASQHASSSLAGPQVTSSLGGQHDSSSLTSQNAGNSLGYSRVRDGPLHHLFTSGESLGYISLLPSPTGSVCW
ncbi:uncharacterized protein LOC131955726 [Physella acuta]|uniref:uncharacterized protein LOC131955726 n=1 Tax=Physella acuta TaxID=109671 RepID=UPI0027DC6B02|nr:uncharacterized protein LOC131955726 [Physella acuta]